MPSAPPGAVVIVGASLAGQRTLAALRRGGYEGHLVLVGAEPHLPYDRPPLSKQILAGTFPAAPVPLASEELYDGVELRLGVAATRLLRGEGRVELSDGTAVAADHVVVATGSAPRPWPGPHPPDGVFLLRTIDDALALRSALEAGGKVVVIGAGFIGCEVAASARAHDLPVSLVEPLQAPVVRGVGTHIGDVIADLHREHGVDLHLGVGVELIEGSQRVEGVRLQDGHTLPADVVVVGIGARPVTGWLEGSGLAVDDGVVCDAHCRAEGGGGRVWVAGDVARWPSRLLGVRLRVEHWTNATEMGAVVAANLLHGPAEVHDPVPYVWSDQHGSRIQLLGVADADARVEVVHGSLVQRRFVAVFVRDGVVRGAVGMSAARALTRCRPHIGRPFDRDALHAALAPA